jgi:1D-myo-inositol-tetrakisphosphate 5-kinase/inositol-polyphosphate multikinase
VTTDKTYGKSLKPEQLSDGIARCFPDDSGLRPTTLHALLVKIAAELYAIRDAIAPIEMRMVGGSVLIVYEGDEDRARLGLELLERQPGFEDERGEENGRENSSDEDENEDEDEDEGDSDDEDTIGPPLRVKIIDFAHTRLTPGEGPDTGVLKGLDTLLRLVEERAAALSGRT